MSFNSRSYSKAYSLSFILLSFLFLMMVVTPATAEEPALTYTPDTESLQWGPYPPFLGEGCEIAVLHGDPTKRNVDIFFKVPQNYTIPRHYHTSPERMVLVSGKMKVTYDNQASEILTPGTYAYGPSERPHKAFCEATGEPCVLFIAFVDPLDAFKLDKKM